MTPIEYRELAEGWEWRHKFQEEREAKYVAILANCSGNMKTRLRIEDILGRNTMQQKREIKERRKVLDERKKRREEIDQQDS